MDGRSPVRVVLVEDDPDDAALVTDALNGTDMLVTVRCVDTEKAFRRELRAGCDIVLSDYTVPGFGALRALEVVEEMEIDTPVIVVSGAIGEDIAIEAMKLGAADYLLKDRLGRLGQAIEQALHRRALQIEKAEVERELARSERRLRAIIDSEPECVKLVSPEGVVLDINPAGAAMLEAGAPSDLIGKPLAPHLYSEDRFAYWQLHKAALAGETGRLKFRVVGRRGTLRWMETHSAPLYDETGAVTGVLSVTRDITETRATEEKLRESDTVLRQLAESIREFFWLMEADRRKVLYASPAFEEIWGRPLAELYADAGTLDRAVHPDDRDEEKRSVAQQASVETRREYRIIRPDGSTRRINSRTFPVKDRAGRTYRIAGVAQDVTNGTAV